MRLLILSSAPAYSDHLENLVLLGCGLLIFVLALALVSFLLNMLSKACAASANWLEHKAARRRRGHRHMLEEVLPSRVLSPLANCSAA